MVPDRKCSIDGCHDKHRAKGFCQRHYWQHKAAERKERRAERRAVAEAEKPLRNPLTNPLESIKLPPGNPNLTGWSLSLPVRTQAELLIAWDQWKEHGGTSRDFAKAAGIHMNVLRDLLSRREQLTTAIDFVLNLRSLSKDSDS